MICYRKPGCGFIGFGTPTGLASRFCLGCMRLRGECARMSYRLNPPHQSPRTRADGTCFPEPRPRFETRNSLPAFETLVAVLPEAQREVVTMLKAGGLSLEEVARATSWTVGAAVNKLLES